MPTYIYALVDPETHELRYVGRTIQRPESRLKGHISESLATARLNRWQWTPKQEWIIALAEAGMFPSITILEEVPDDEAKIREAEKEWIARLKEEGHSILNVSYTGVRGDRIRLLNQKRSDHQDPSFDAPPAITAEELRRRREALGFSQGKIAKAIGYHYSLVSRWESGDRPIPDRVAGLLERIEQQRGQ